MVGGGVGCDFGFPGLGGLVSCIRLVWLSWFGFWICGGFF